MTDGSLVGLRLQTVVLIIQIGTEEGRGGRRGGDKREGNWRKGVAVRGGVKENR